jgi:hypothetical protein
MQLRLFPNRLEFDTDAYAFDAVDVAHGELGVKKATSPLTLGMVETRCALLRIHHESDARGLC